MGVNQDNPRTRHWKGTQMSSTTTELTERTRLAAETMYGSVARGDLDTFMSYVSPSVVIVEPEYLPYGGRYQGLDGLQQLFVEFAARFDLSGLQIERIVVDGAHVCAICRVPTAGGKSVVEFIEHAVFENERAVELRIYMHHLGDLIESMA
jgi:SnoaL-like protein